MAGGSLLVRWGSPMPRAMQRWPGWASAFACGVLVGLAILAGLGSLLATAALTARPAVFLAAGWAVFALGTAVAARIGCAPRWRWPVAACSIVALSAIAGGALLRPRLATAPPPPPEAEWMPLPGGARLAYLEIPAVQPVHATPVIFLHGGPGMADMAGDAPYLRGLAADGFDVYLYDQLGVGQSSRVADPADYTLPRGVSDLNSFRKAIHAARVDLIGYSWGATLASAYLAAHADRVAKIVFVSPAAMAGQTNDLIGLLQRLDAPHLWALSRQALAPRALIAWMLAQVNPRAARAFAGNAEMDARFRAAIAALSPAFFCHPPPRTTGGHPGFYALAMLLRPLASRGTDPHAALRHVETPALILKGQCDYLDWATALDYRDTLVNSRLVYLPGAGHRLFAERPRAFVASVAAFLEGKALPFAAVTGSAPPPGYAGP
jgi:proline iminopeptidase